MTFERVTREANGFLLSGPRAWLPYGFSKITARANYMTGEMILLDPPVEVHSDDVDAWLESWWAIDELGWRIALAELVAKAGA